MAITHKAFSSQQTILEFGGKFYIVCPECSRCAIVQSGDVGRVALTCLSCGYACEDSKRRCSIAFASNSKAYDDQSIGIGAPVDWYFHLPLWLQAPCCGEVLWAYNEKHLAFLEAFVAAKQRTGVRGEHGWSNQSLMNRLPQWVKQAKNRDEILRCLGKLKQRLADYEQELSH